MRQFDTGATRDNEVGKFDYDGFLSPLVLHRFAQYMHKHRVQKDGSLRDSDNWQKGIPMEAYRKSLWRHFMDTWAIMRGWFSCVGQADTPEEIDLEDALCGVLFNTQGMLHEMIKARLAGQEAATILDEFAKCDVWHEPTVQDMIDMCPGGTEPGDHCSNIKQKPPTTSMRGMRFA